MAIERRSSARQRWVSADALRHSFADVAADTTGWLDTNILIDPPAVLPDDTFGSSILSLAELHFGVEVAADVAVRAQRQRRLVQVRELFDWIPFDEYAAESYGTLAAAVARTRPGHARSKDIMIASQAHALGVPLMTRNASDFALVSDLVQIVPVD